MLWIDQAAVALVAFFTVIGLLRGAKLAMLALLTWWTAIVVGWFFSQNLALLLVKTVPESALQLAFAFGLLVGETVLLGWIIRLLLGKMIKTNGVALVSRIVGALMGAGQGTAVLFSAVVIAGLTALPQDSWWGQSRYVPIFQAFAVTMKQHCPSKIGYFLNFPSR